MVFSWKRCRVFYVKNFEQHIVDKLSKSNKIGVSVKCLRGDFLQFPSAIVKFVISSRQLDTSL